MRLWTLPTCLALVMVASQGFSKCAIPQAETVTSADGKMSVTLNPDGTLMVADGPVKHSRKVELPGHHFEIALSEGGDRLVAWDVYGGVNLYSLTSEKWSFGRSGDSFLSKAQQSNRANKWSCHPEGKWLDQVSLTAETAQLRLYDGSIVWLRLQDGHVVKQIPSTNTRYGAIAVSFAIVAALLAAFVRQALSTTKK